MVAAWLIGADVSISDDDLASEPLGRPPAGGLTSYDKVLPPFSTSSSTTPRLPFRRPLIELHTLQVFQFALPLPSPSCPKSISACIQASSLVLGDSKSSD